MYIEESNKHISKPETIQLANRKIVLSIIPIVNKEWKILSQSGDFFLSKKLLGIFISIRLQLLLFVIILSKKIKIKKKNAKEYNRSAWVQKLKHAQETRNPKYSTCIKKKNTKRKWIICCPKNVTIADVINSLIKFTPFQVKVKYIYNKGDNFYKHQRWLSLKFFIMFLIF